MQQRLIAAAFERASPAAAPTGDLAARELEMLRLIASTLVVSGATVKTHVNCILAKTGARDRAQAARYAFEHGLAGRQ